MFNEQVMNIAANLLCEDFEPLCSKEHYNTEENSSGHAVVHLIGKELLH